MAKANKKFGVFHDALSHAKGIMDRRNDVVIFFIMDPVGVWINLNRGKQKWDKIVSWQMIASNRANTLITTLDDMMGRIDSVLQRNT